MFQQAIHQIQLHYCSLSDATVQKMEPCCTISSIPKGTVLVKEGAYSDQLYFIIKGAVKAYYLKDGKNITDWFAFENDFICAINSFFSDVPSPHYIETLEASNLLAIGRQQIDWLCEEHHDFERLARLGVTRTMLRLQKRVVALQFETARNRYLNLLKVHPDIELRVPLGDIASYIGITQETLSRIRSGQL
jgi:CRP-like cAMP-binding protein